MHTFFAWLADILYFESIVGWIEVVMVDESIQSSQKYNTDPYQISNKNIAKVSVSYQHGVNIHKHTHHIRQIHYLSFEVSFDKKR